VKQFIEPSDIAAEVLMKRCAHKGSFLVVEGGTDAQLYGKFTDPKECIIVVGHNKKNVIGAVSLLIDRGFHGVAGIVDSDFDDVLERLHDRTMIHTTDTHDLETMIIQSPALERVVSALADERKLQDFLERNRNDLRGMLIEGTRPVGLLILFHIQNRAGLFFEDLRFEQFLDLARLTVNCSKLVIHVINSSPGSRYRQEDIQEALQLLLAKQYDPWQICRGHDMTELLYIGLREHFGRSDFEVRKKDLESTLRHAYDEGSFAKTRLFHSMVDWEAKNRPYRILRIGVSGAMTMRRTSDECS